MVPLSPEVVIALALIQHGPAMARQLRDAFKKETISDADWEGVFATYKTPYEAYIAPVTPTS